MTNTTCEGCKNAAFCNPVFLAYESEYLSRQELVTLVKENRFPCAERDRSKDGPLFWLVAQIQKWLEESG